MSGQVIQGWLPAGVIAERLRERIEDLARELLPEGRREGREWRGHGPDGAVWAVCLSGTKRGVFFDTCDNRYRGDALELVRHLVTRGDRGEACRWAMRWLGEPIGTPAPAAPRRPRDRTDDTEQRRKAALARWLGGRAIEGTPAAEYLANRGVQLRRLARPPQILHFADGISHPGLQRFVPAMLALIVKPVDGSIRAVHATFLERGPDADWGKLRTPPAKLTLGPVKGGCIPLTRGQSGKRLVEAPPGDLILVSEGIEDGLTAAMVFPERRAFAAVAVGNLAAIEWPPAFTNIMLILQRDAENDAVARARQQAVNRWIDEGRTVKTYTVPDGYHDINEYWQHVTRRRTDGERPGGAAGI